MASIQGCGHNKSLIKMIDVSHFLSFFFFFPVRSSINCKGRKKYRDISEVGTKYYTGEKIKMKNEVLSRGTFPYLLTFMFH